MKNIVFLLFSLLFISCSPKNLLKEEKERFIGFTKTKNFNENEKVIYFDPEVRIVINVSSTEWVDKKPTNIIFYALPNGNSIEWTKGKKVKDSLDWYFGIQHIAAQTRSLREFIKEENIVIVYLENNLKSWPSWRRKYENSSYLISKIIDTVVSHFKYSGYEITLTGHSGGGSFIFGYLNGKYKISEKVKRITFLDSNYGYTDLFGDKFIDWLKSSKENHLGVICYDDRKVILNGKRIVSDTGGTFSRTQMMVDKFNPIFKLNKKYEKDCFFFRDNENKIDIIMHTNPKSEILHTILVGDYSGFIHSMAFGTKYEDKIAKFMDQAPYTKWIEED